MQNFVASVASILYSQFNQLLLLGLGCLAHYRILPALGSGPLLAAGPGSVSKEWCRLRFVAVLPTSAGWHTSAVHLTHITSLHVETTDVCF